MEETIKILLERLSSEDEEVVFQALNDLHILAYPAQDDCPLVGSTGFYQAFHQNPQNFGGSPLGLAAVKIHEMSFKTDRLRSMARSTLAVCLGAIEPADEAEYQRIIGGLPCS
jgi:hypothetical protein